MTKENLQTLLKQNQVLVDTKHTQISVDDFGFPNYQLDYINPPTYYRLVRAFEHLECAILEDLDYKEALQDEEANKA